MRGERPGRFGVGLAVALALAVPVCASAHQTASDNGATVTVHVNPDDEPTAGRTAYLYVTKVRVGRRARFRWARCSCRLTVTSAAGEPVVDMGLRRGGPIPLVFPQEGAYTIAFSGRYRKRHRWRPFSVSFGIRADAEGSPTSGGTEE